MDTLARLRGRAIIWSNGARRTDLEACPAKPLLDNLIAEAGDGSSFHAGDKPAYSGIPASARRTLGRNCDRRPASSIRKPPTHLIAEDFIPLNINPDTFQVVTIRAIPPGAPTDGSGAHENLLCDYRYIMADRYSNVLGGNYHCDIFPRGRIAASQTQAIDPGCFIQIFLAPCRNGDTPGAFFLEANHFPAGTRIQVELRGRVYDQQHIGIYPFADDYCLNPPGFGVVYWNEGSANPGDPNDSLKSCQGTGSKYFQTVDNYARAGYNWNTDYFYWSATSPFSGWTPSPRYPTRYREACL